ALDLFAGCPQLVALPCELLLPCIEVRLVSRNRGKRFGELRIERIPFDIPCPECFTNRVVVKRRRKCHCNWMRACGSSVRRSSAARTTTCPNDKTKEKCLA